jgi:hypothetical protein
LASNEQTNPSTHEEQRVEITSFAERTVRIRHALVKMIAPKIYQNSRAAETDLSVLLKQVGIEVERVPRPMIKFLKERGRASLCGVEIGVMNGCNALNVLQVLPVKKLFLIDPYVPYFDCDRYEVDLSDAKKEAKEKLSVYPQAQFIEKCSNLAVSDVDTLQDFVYIDGNHSYSYVKEDIELYHPLVKENGVLGGHDYIEWVPTVGRAVDEFVEKHNYERGVDFFTVFPDWWIIKH